MDRRRALSSVLILGVGSSACPGAGWSADTYPSRPLRIIVTSSAGGVQDVNLRRVAEGLARNLGQAEALVTGSNYFLAFLHVQGEAPDVRHEHTGFAGNVRAHVPGAAGGAQIGPRYLVDM